MNQTSFEKFIRFGGSTTFILKTGSYPGHAFKQETPSTGDVVRNWVDGVWSRTFGATSQAILKTEPFEFSAAGLSGIDQETLRADATDAVRSALEREGFDLASIEWEQRALAVLVGFLNQAQQEAMGIEFYVWATQHDPRVRGSHADRDDKIFRWDFPPEGGHPSQDFGCRCYAVPLGKEGYWERVSEGVEVTSSDLAEGEGNVDHMYLDSENNVTVGQGTKLNNAEEAAALPFLFRTTRGSASADDIRTEYELLDAMAGSTSFPASYYEQFTQLVLNQTTIDGLVTEHIRGDFDGLLKIFPEFGNFPLPAQVAIWDMVYNLGLAGFRRKFPNLQDAAREGNWEIAAEESERSNVGDDRNDYVHNLFLDAARTP